MANSKHTLLFLSYINRSGSTYLVNLLSKSESICVCPEAEILYTLLLKRPHQKIDTDRITTIFSIIQKDIKFKQWKINLEFQNLDKCSGLDIFIRIVEKFKNTYYPQARFILYKHNHLIELIDKIQQDSNINIYWINLLRNPKAIFASQKHTVSPLTKKRMGVNPISFISEWNTFYLSAKEYRSMANVITIRFEELVTNTNAALFDIFNFLSIKISSKDITDKVGQVYQWLSDGHKHIHSNINHPPNTGSLNLWNDRLSNTDIQIIDKNQIDNADYLSNNQSRHSIYVKILIFRYRILGKILRIKSGILKTIRSVDY